MILDAISQYILAIVPSVTAIIGMIVALGVGIGQIKKANSESTKEVREVSKNDRDLKRQLKEVHRENVELKQQLNEVLARLKHMYFVEEESKKE